MAGGAAHLHASSDLPVALAMTPCVQTLFETTKRLINYTLQPPLRKESAIRPRGAFSPSDPAAAQAFCLSDRPKPPWAPCV
jgi:hypothetical protein